MISGTHLLTLAIIITANVIAVYFICLIGIKLAKINKTHVIYIRQYLLTMSSTVVISCFLPVTVAAVLFCALFFVYRNIVFRKNALEIQRIDRLYKDEITSCPPVTSFSQVLTCNYTGDTTECVDKGYLYAFSQYMNHSIYIFIFYLIGSDARPESLVLYGIEFFVAMTALFLIVGKLVYHLAFKPPTSLFYLSPVLAYIPVFLNGVLFYTIAISIFISTL